ncbi:MAG: hypothetical protein ACI8Z5_001291 [Lentimonas sp.]|jgi:hypothetical protein
MATKCLTIKVKAAYDAAVQLYYRSYMEDHPGSQEISALYHDAILRKDTEWIHDFHTTMEAMFRYIGSNEHKEKESFRMHIWAIEYERGQLLPEGQPKAHLSSYALAERLKIRFKSHYENTTR